MSGRYLLDTNIVIALFAEDAAVMKEIETASEIFIPSITLGELYYGAQSSNRTRKNIDRIDNLQIKNAILNCDASTAAQYGTVKMKLKEQGRPIPENDIWIASLALQHKLMLVSRDKHFQYVTGLARISWELA